MAKLNNNEKKWQAENDAYTLAEASKIQLDPNRMAAASKVAAKMAEEQKKQVEVLNKIANKTKKKTSNGKKK